MNDPTSAAWEELEEAFRQRGAELTRLRAQQTVLRDALTEISSHPAAQSTKGRADWLTTCGEMRLIAAKALATLDVPDTKEQT